MRDRLYRIHNWVKIKQKTTKGIVKQFWVENGGKEFVVIFWASNDLACAMLAFMSTIY